jgi:hypothetical protein
VRLRAQNLCSAAAKGKRGYASDSLRAKCSKSFRRPRKTPKKASLGTLVRTTRAV